MSDMETAKTLVTPRGRTLHPVRWRNNPEVTSWRGDPLKVWRIPSGRFTADFDDGTQMDCDTIAEALDWLDARADETVAALLPPGSMVVTEDRVVELASLLVKRVAGDHVSGLARVGAVNALIADLRAGAQS